MTPQLVRPPAVAGTFYPADASALRDAMRDAFAGAVRPALDAPVPRAIVVPHAGFMYSGPIAAGAYLRIQPGRGAITRVVLLGPSHRVPLRGLALSSADAWSTPLGLVPLDVGAREALLELPHVTIDDRPHAPEHSLEVQLPFLQTVLADFQLLPLVVGNAGPDEVAAVIEAQWHVDGTLIVISTDLSHYHAYDDAVRLDARTVAAIAARRPGDIDDQDACGARPLRGLLTAANRHDAHIELLDVRNSGDTAGNRDRVVGYGAFAVT